MIDKLKLLTTSSFTGGFSFWTLITAVSFSSILGADTGLDQDIGTESINHVKRGGDGEEVSDILELHSYPIHPILVLFLISRAYSYTSCPIPILSYSGA